MKQKRRWRISRRGFLIGLGVSGGGLALGYTFGKPVVQRRIAGTLNQGASGFRGKTDQAPAVWFEIDPDNQVMLHVPKIEMGQGIHTALAQIAAEELEADWKQIRVVQASSARGFGNLSGTSASTSVSSLYLPLRKTAATMREMLKTEAGQLLRANPVELVAENGRVSAVSKGGSLSYGEIVARVDKWNIPKQAPALKDKSKFKWIGKPMPRLDFPDKLTGKATYGYDARVEGMLYGAVARAPRIGATLKSASAGAAATMPGVVKVVIEPGFAGVVAQSRSKARAALEQMQLEWEGGINLNQADIDRIVTVREGTGVVIQSEGRTKPALAAGKVVQAEYRSPFAAHAHLEPQAALADVQEGKVMVWTSTQFPELVKNDVAKATGVKAETVEVQATYLGGGFGRRGKGDAASEAARLSKAVGKPVHVGWNRSEEFRHGYLRPPTHSLLRGSLDSSGKLLAFEHHQASGDVAFGFLPGFLEPVFGADFGAWRGSFIPYQVPRLTSAQRSKIPVPTGWWRGLGLLANTFALESFVDELAAEAKADPLAFRLDHLPDNPEGQRLKTVLQAAAQKAGWGKPLPPGRALGIACCIDVRTAVAEVAEVSVENGQITVHKVTAAVDPGLIINPDGVKAQTEGSIVMGLSSAFLERLTLKDGQIEAGNFDQYPLITMNRIPQIEVVLLESGDEPFGMGEPPIGPIAAAVGNGVFALTGKRLRELPLQL
jgi:isoquinoline 1-oxidoreductase beta subunit